MRNYMGLATTPHDPALAIVDSCGEVVFAEAAERYLQNKRAWNSIPDQLQRARPLISRYVEAGADLVLCCSWRKPSIVSALGARLLVFPLLKRALAPEHYEAVSALATGIYANSLSAGMNTRWQASQTRPDMRLEVRGYDHHLTHAAAACYTSSFREADCAVIDGYGEGFTTARFYRYRGGSITPIRAIRPSRWVSLGLFYDAVCSACGFDPLMGEAWKVMGLSAYGRLDLRMYSVLRSYMEVEKGQLRRNSGSLRVYEQIAEMGRVPDEPVLKAADLACTAQHVFAEWMTELLTDLHRARPSCNLVLGGGCALNSAYNGQILEQTPFESLHVFSAPADDGNAVGAALLAFHEDNPNTGLGQKLQMPYLGETMSDETLANAVRLGGLTSTVPAGKRVSEYAAELLAAGKIVGWVQGRAEFGPRALGNRSILADPRPRDIKERINSKVKFREPFRPFAPSILHEFGERFFENYQESPYMERALRFRKDLAESVPGVVHVDGTGRLQTVKREWNECFYDLISAFHKLTGVPLVLNTSFNVMGKPIVHTVEDALAVFMTTGMDALVIGDQVFEKRNGSADQEPGETRKKTGTPAIRGIRG
jgi:carbamoyltransferase